MLYVVLVLAEVYVYNTIIQVIPMSSLLLHWLHIMDPMLSSLTMYTAMGQNQIFSAVKDKSGLLSTAVGYVQELLAYKVHVASL